MKRITALAILLILVGCSNDHHEQAQSHEQVDVAPQADEELAPEQDEIYHFLLGEIAVDRDQPAVALKEYEILNKTAPDALTAARATSIAIEQKDFISAARSAKIWADAMPNDVQTQAIAASIMLKTNNIDEALPFMSRMMDKDDQKTFEHLLILRSTLEDEKHAQAFVELMNAYGTQAKDYRALFMGASTAMELKDMTAATEMSNKINQINPTWARGAVLRVQLLYQAGKMDQALSSIAQLIKDNPNEGMYKYLQAKMLLEKGDLDSSLKSLNALKLDPKYRDEALMDLARVSIQKKDYKTANEVLTQYLSYEPNSDEAKYYAGYVAQHLGQAQLAMQRFREIKPGAYYVNANIQMALLLGSQGKVDDGLKLLDPLLDKFPKDKERIDLVKTQLLLDANRIEEAYGSLNKILTTNDSDTELRYIRGLIAMELGHPDQAESDFRYVVSKEPRHVEAINDLSMLLIDQKDYDEARQFIDQALSIAPKDPKALGNMGWLLHELGKKSEALSYLEKANKANNQDDVIAAHYGEALWEANKKDEAVTVWNRALKYNPHAPLLLKVMKEHVVTPAAN